MGERAERNAGACSAGRGSGLNARRFGPACRARWATVTAQARAWWPVLRLPRGRRPGPSWVGAWLPPVPPCRRSLPHPHTLKSACTRHPLLPSSVLLILCIHLYTPLLAIHHAPLPPSRPPDLPREFTCLRAPVPRPHSDPGKPGDADGTICALTHHTVIVIADPVSAPPSSSAATSRSTSTSRTSSSTT